MIGIVKEKSIPTKGTWDLIPKHHCNSENTPISASASISNKQSNKQHIDKGFSFREKDDQGWLVGRSQQTDWLGQFRRKCFYALHLCACLKPKFGGEPEFRVLATAWSSQVKGQGMDNCECRQDFSFLLVWNLRPSSPWKLSLLLQLGNRELSNSGWIKSLGPFRHDTGLWWSYCWALQ